MIVMALGKKLKRGGRANLTGGDVMFPVVSDADLGGSRRVRAGRGRKRVGL